MLWKHRGRMGGLPGGGDIFAGLGQGGHPRQREQQVQKQREQARHLQEESSREVPKGLTHTQGEAVCCSSQCGNQAACP